MFNNSKEKLQKIIFVESAWVERLEYVKIPLCKIEVI